MSKKMMILTMAAAATIAAAASAAEPGTPGAPQNEKSLVLYVTKSFGDTGARARSPLAFGLKLQQSAPFDPRRSVALADYRFSLNGRQEFRTFGVLALRLGGEDDGKPSSSSSSSGVPIREHPVASGIIIGLGILGLSCAAELGICKNRGKKYETPSETPTGPG